MIAMCVFNALEATIKPKSRQLAQCQRVRERVRVRERERAYLIAYAEAERINCEELISRVVHFIVQFTLILWAMNSRKGVRGKGQGARVLAT